MKERGSDRIREKSRSIEGAAVAGIAFSLLYSVGFYILVHRTTRTDPSTWDVWVADPSHRRSSILALNMMAFASIGFLWFMAVVRRRVGDREDRFFSTVFLGSGLLNVALILVGSSAIASVPIAAQSEFGADIAGSSAAVMVGFGFSLVVVILPRIQAVFILSVSTLALRTSTFRRGIAVFGYVTAVAMLLFPLLFDSLGLAFPIWVLVISVALLLRSTLIDSGPGPQSEDSA